MLNLVGAELKIKMVMNIELGETWEETVLTYFKVLL